MSLCQVVSEVALGVGAQLSAGDGADDPLHGQGIQRAGVKAKKLGRSLLGDQGPLREGRSKASLRCRAKMNRGRRVRLRHEPI